MKRRLLAAVAASAMILAAGVPSTAMAAAPVRHYQRATLTKIDPSFKPWLADPSHKVTAVLQLTDDPALAVPGLTKAQQRTRAGTLRAGQGKLDGSIKADGGRVLGRYQYAYNGIKVQATGAQLTRLAALPGVVAVKPVRTYTPDNVNAIPYVQAPAAWQYNGATGAGETIAVIDTGIDYTHADFGGPGTPAAYAAIDPTKITPGTFPTAKVIAGYDFAGNAYNADLSTSVPVPDPNPLDCADHGTHVAGTAAGDGVTAAHTTYTGPYNTSTLADPSKFTVGPGVAPQAKLVALKVFGCSGSTNLVVDALEWVAAYNAAHSDGIDVVNMSLGSPFGAKDDPDAIATDNLVATGVVVVASAGNENSVPYITGAPAAATSAISVAALDAFPSVPLASITGAGSPIAGNNQNGYPGLPVTGTLHVLGDGVSPTSLGCIASDYGAASVGKIVAIRRGTCTFVEKGAAAEAAGAIGVIDVNRPGTDTTDTSLPAYIGYNPELFTIPMIGVNRTLWPTLQAHEGATVTLASAGSEPNPTFKQIAGFSSSGPRWGDSWLKPDLAAPGVNLLSALDGSGWNGTTYSGTSMAAPMTSGAAALVREAHPGWSPLKVKAALANTADASSALISGYDPLRAGSGVIQVNRAVATNVVATTSDRTASLNYGYEQANGAYSETKAITLSNSGNKAATYKLAATTPLVTVWPSTVRVPGHGSVTVIARAYLSRAQVAALPSADQNLTGDFGGLSSLAGAVVATPTKAGPGVFALRVPYVVVPRGLSDVSASLSGSGGPNPKTSAGSHDALALQVKNNGVHAGAADVYALGITDPRGDGSRGTDVRAVGVQSVPTEAFGLPANANDRGIQFAVNMWDRFTTMAPNEVDIAIDTNGDGTPDRIVVGLDDGIASGTGAYDGVYLSIIFDGSFNYIDSWLADAPLNGSTLLLPALASDLGLTPGAGSFTYQVTAIDGFTGVADQTATSTKFDAFTPAQSTGDFVPVASKAHATIPAWYTKAAGVLGWMVVSLDDANGAAQADLVRVPVKH